MSIVKHIAPISLGAELVKKILIEEFNFREPIADKLSNNVRPHFDKLSVNTYLIAETTYVDKVYRDSYYHYYSSKLGLYQRDCVRISLFDGEINEHDFRGSTKLRELRNRYRGFIVLRPTERKVIGRSVISPKILQQVNFICCSAEIGSTVDGIKFTADGFPHSSQDGETMSCAETTIWAIMEYFSSKYAEYTPVLPSKIITTLNKLTSERQLPSKGLNTQQMSYALREFGFGTRIYSKAQHGDQFENLISIYVESGIPVILAIDNKDKGGKIGHAILCIGREQEVSIDKVPPNIIPDAKTHHAAGALGLNIYDWHAAKKDFVFVDDNYPVYQKGSLIAPTLHYPTNEWQKCTIRHFIAPLYRKIYLEAFTAKSFIYKFLVEGPKPLRKNSNVWIKFFLASSRSYKHHLALNDTFQADVRDRIIEKPMPKFIWVAEITEGELRKGYANGIVILDSTEANTHFIKPLIMAAYQDQLIEFENGKIREDVVTLQPFSIYEQNLKTFDDDKDN